MAAKQALHKLHTDSRLHDMPPMLRVFVENKGPDGHASYSPKRRAHRDELPTGSALKRSHNILILHVPDILPVAAVDEPVESPCGL